MRRFLCNLAVLGLVTMLIACLLESMLKIKFQQPTDIYQDWQVLDKINAQILFVGNSRTVTHFNSSAISSASGKSVYCLGTLGYSQELILHKLDVYLEKNVAPEILFLQVGPTFNKNTQSFYAKTIYRKYLFQDRFGIHSKTIQLDGANYVDRYLPLFRYRGDLHRFIQDLFCIKPKAQRLGGYNQPQEDKWNGDNIGTLASDIEFDHDLLDSAIKIIKQNKKLVNTQVILSIPPFTTNVYAKIDWGNLEQTALQNDFALVDWNKLGVSCYSSTAFFRDNYHLNSIGVGCLTRDVVEWLESENYSLHKY